MLVKKNGDLANHQQHEKVKMFELSVNYVISKLKPREKTYLTNEIDSNIVYNANNHGLYTP